MKIKLTSIVLALLAATVAAQATEPAIIPQPQQMTVKEGVFELTAKTKIAAFKDSKASATKLAQALRPATGLKLPISKAATAASPAEIRLVLSFKDAAALGDEGYTLSVTPEHVEITAATEAGLFYGGQTLLQLLPPEIFSGKKVSGVKWQVPCVEISDVPRFRWRGFMLDVSRHFFTKAEVKQVLDAMVLHKLNTFHWHLVDDNGWRIEIKKYPKLTKVAAWRDSVGFGLPANSTTAYRKDGRYGGFYTQDDIREVVAYAAARHITVVPEIEMPGHASAALFAYPQYLCPDVKIPAIPEAGGVMHGIYCAGNDEVFPFLEDILAEVGPLFPGKFIHIGGDEVPKDNWKKCARCQARIKQEGLKNEHELQSYFIHRIESILNEQGKTLIGWSEIREGGIAPGAALMDWIGGGAESAASGHDVVMTPNSHCYLDYYQSVDAASEPRAIGGFLPLEKVYSFEPIPAKLSPDKHKHILGAQGNLWTEYIPNIKQLQYMAFPRLTALAEVGWSPNDARDFEGFTRRLKTHERRLDNLGVSYRSSALCDGTKTVGVKIGEWRPAQLANTPAPIDWGVTDKVAANGRVEVRFQPTHGTNSVEISWAALLEDGKEIGRATRANPAGQSLSKSVYTIDVPAPKAGAKYTLRAQVASLGGNDSRGNVLWLFKSAN